MLIEWCRRRRWTVRRGRKGQSVLEWCAQLRSPRMSNVRALMVCAPALEKIDR